MQKQTHIFFGLFLAAVLWTFFDLGIDVFVFTALGATIPDLDFKKIFRKYHRKIFHNLWFIGVIFFLTRDQIGMAVALGFLLGSLSHLIADSFTPTGIYPLWPIKKHVCLNRYVGVTTGKESEIYFNYLIIVLTTSLIFLEYTTGGIFRTSRQDLFNALLVSAFVIMILMHRKKFLPSSYR